LVIETKNLPSLNLRSGSPIDLPPEMSCNEPSPKAGEKVAHTASDGSHKQADEANHQTQKPSDDVISNVSNDEAEYLSEMEGGT
jgi:hypothetical protein